MNRKKAWLEAVLGASLALAASGCVRPDPCSSTAARELSLDAAGASRLRVVAGPGSLSVKGVPGATRVSAHGTACASNPGLLEQVRLEGHRFGDELVIETRQPRPSWGSDSASLDLAIELPEGLAVDVTDGSGGAQVEHVASLRFADDSGALLIVDVAGEVQVVDGSGDLSIERVGGRLRLEDSSGDADISDVGGDIEVEDGSGNLVIRGARKNVVILEDSSGDIQVSQVGGDVRVRDDGSGDIRVSEVAGSFTVEHDGSGRITSSGVSGRVSVPPG